MTKSRTSRKKRLLIGVAGLGIFAALAIFGIRSYQAEDLPKAETQLKFDRAALDFTHAFDAEAMLPFLASAAFDMDGDTRPELFLGGGVGQADALFKYVDGAFKRTDVVFEKLDTAATHGAAHLDVDGDGDTDLFLARSNAVALFINQNGEYTKSSATFPLAENTTPLSIALGDINSDGHVDLYISGYLKIDRIEGETIFTGNYGGYSALYLGQPNGTWTDATSQAGVLRQHNSFTAGFVDLDGDSLQDLVVAQDTGVIETWKNSNSLPLTRTENPSVNSYPMGLGFGDIDNDGDVDIWASNVGHTLPGKLLRGDLPEDALFNTDYYLLENDGTGKFTDVAKEKGVARLGFGWGSVIADMDLDGRADLLAAQNYARLPGNGLLRSYPGKLLLQQTDGTFADATAVSPDAGFGISPLVADFNADGAPDLVWANLAGESRAWVSAGGTGTSIRVPLPNRTEFLGALVRVTDSTGRQQSKRLITGEGLGSDSSRTLIFGLGDAEFTQAEIILRDGSRQMFKTAIDGTLTWKN